MNTGQPDFEYWKNGRLGCLCTVVRILKVGLKHTNRLRLRKNTVYISLSSFVGLKKIVAEIAADCLRTMESCYICIKLTKIIF